jgi:hypothetical protein
MPLGENSALGHRVFRETLCPLGQPEKAIGYEPPIEPWLALPQPACLFASDTERRRHDCAMNPGKSEITAPHRHTGLDDNTPSSRRRSVFLTYPFYRTALSEAGPGQPPLRSKRLRSHIENLRNAVTRPKSSKIVHLGHATSVLSRNKSGVLFCAAQSERKNKSRSGGAAFARLN